MTGYGFSFESEDESLDGMLWVDDLSLTSGVERVTPTPAAEPGEEVEEPEEPEESPEETGGGICASALLVPLALLTRIWTRIGRINGFGRKPGSQVF